MPPRPAGLQWHRQRHSSPKTLQPVRPFLISLVIQDQPEVSPLSGRGKVRTSIRAITARPSLPPASSTPSSTGPPLRMAFHLLMETVGLTTFHTSTTPGGFRLYLSAGGATSARGVVVAPLPRHLPFGSSTSASLACCLLRRLNSTSPELAIPPNASPKDAPIKRAKS